LLLRSGLISRRPLATLFGGTSPLGQGLLALFDSSIVVRGCFVAAAWTAFCAESKILTTLRDDVNLIFEEGASVFVASPVASPNEYFARFRWKSNFGESALIRDRPVFEAMPLDFIRILHCDPDGLGDKFHCLLTPFG
jgi:hypothetical protein